MSTGLANTARQVSLDKPPLIGGSGAKIDEKPEVRKAGGVYYTPAYIVEYIVANTVGQQIDARSPSQLAGYKDNPSFRVLDMACGSGSHFFWERISTF